MHRLRGQALVEFTLVFLLFFLLILGVIEFGHALYVYTATAHAATEAARFGATTGSEPAQEPNYRNCDGIRQAALRVGALAGIQPADITIAYDHGPGTDIFASCPAPPNAIRGGDRIVVTVKATYKPLVPLLPQVEIPLEATVARTLLGTVYVAEP